MKYTIALLFLLCLLAAGCKKVVLKQEMPSSPKESYGELEKNSEKSR